MRLQLLPHIVLHNGDGLCFGDKGFAINRVDGEWIQVNQSVDILPRTTLYRNLDTSFIRTLNAKRRIPIDIRFEVTSGGYCLTIGEQSATFEATHQEATNPQRALQTLREQLSKLGDTHLTAATITIVANNEVCTETFPYFIPISHINQWRRQLTQI